MSAIMSGDLAGMAGVKTNEDNGDADVCTEGMKMRGWMSSGCGGG